MSGKFDFNYGRMSDRLRREMSRYFGVGVAIIRWEISSKKEFFRPYCFESTISISFCWRFDVSVETRSWLKLIFTEKLLAVPLASACVDSVSLQTEFACPFYFESVAARRLCWPFSITVGTPSRLNPSCREQLSALAFFASSCVCFVFSSLLQNKGSSSWRSYRVIFTGWEFPFKTCRLRGH